MSNRFTIVIPTRERCDTLEWALKTCVTQDYDNLEIIVSDNASTDGTEEVVRSFRDARIRYINTGKRLSMSENFEFALAHTGEGHIGFIGDDDGLLPNALRELDPIVTNRHCKAIVWPMQIYYWPGYIEETLANTLSMSIPQVPAIQELSSSTMLRRVATFRDRYNVLPSFYFGFVHHSVISTILQNSNRFFHSITPDVYSAIATASILDSYHFSTRAYSLAGQSKHSNGASQLSGQGNRDNGSANARFMKENTIPFHPSVPYAPSVPFIVAEAFMQVRDHVRSARHVDIDLRNVIDAAMRDQNALFNLNLRQEIKAAIRSLATIHGLEDYAEAAIAKADSLRYLYAAQAAMRSILLYPPIFDLDRERVTNIYDATLAFRALTASHDSRAKQQWDVFKARTLKAARIAKTSASQLSRKYS